MEPGGSLPHLQGSATCPYPQRLILHDFKDAAANVTWDFYLSTDQQNIIRLLKAQSN
jgi:hypothetical protein